MNGGKSPALGDEQAKAMLEARAILSVLLVPRPAARGVAHLRVQGKGGKIRFIPAHPHSLQRITEYLEKSQRGDMAAQPLFVRVTAGKGRAETALTGHAIFKDVVQRYARQLGFEPRSVCVHGLRATAATNALDHNAGIEKVQDWPGHASIQTTRLYDRRKAKAEDSPTFKVAY